MKINKTTLSTLLAAACLVGPALPAQAGLVVSLNPSATSIAVGSTVNVDVVISGLSSAGEIVGGYDLDILFSSSVLSAISGVNNSAPWGGPVEDPGFIFDNSTPGQVYISLLSFLLDDDLATLQGDSITLATLTFEGDSDGATSVYFGADVPYQRNIVGRRAQTLDVSYGSTCIAVGSGACSTVPEPASYALVGLAMAGMLPVLRRRQSRKTTSA